MTKFYPLDQLIPLIRALKAQGKRIILANGCFDLIHVGHIRYLKEARELGDVLVVAINSDRSVARLKGPGRPILVEGERKEILAALSCVDFITVFDEPRVDSVLLAIKPDVHAKGSDYTPETVPEKDTVKAYGGDVVITGGEKVRSTSEIIRDIRTRMREFEG